VAKPFDYEGDKCKVYSGAGRGETFADILTRRISRRGALKVGATISGVAAAGAVTTALGQDASPAASPGASPAASPAASPTAGGSNLTFEAIALDTSDQLLVAAGHTATAFLRWGDPITADAPEFDVENQTAESQSQQFGYNADWIGFLPLPQGSQSTDRGLLIVNHEYTNPELMFPGYLEANPEYTGDDEEIEPFIPSPIQDFVDVELEAHGLSIVEIARNGDSWEVVRDSEYNRRITATTPTELTGPAAGADLLKTSEDDTGTQVTGTLNNCAGGTTPWGTIISGEENFQQYFGQNQYSS
jgi:uncharacterized protein